VSGTVAEVAKPSSAGPVFQDHLQRLAVRPGVAFAKPVQNSFKYITDRGFHGDLLLGVERHILKLHTLSPYVTK
jgi:hypothetical protein